MKTINIGIEMDVEIPSPYWEEWRLHLYIASDPLHFLTEQIYSTLYKLYDVNFPLAMESSMLRQY